MARVRDDVLAHRPRRSLMTEQTSTPGQDRAGHRPRRRSSRGCARSCAARSASPSSSTAPVPAGPSCSAPAQSCALAYRVDDGIPVLLVDEARSPPADPPIRESPPWHRSSTSRCIDDPDSIAARDTGETLRALATAGAQVREAITLSAEAHIDRVAGGERPRSVLVASLGGSRRRRRRPGAAGRAGLAGAGQRAAQPAAAGLGRAAGPRRRRLAVRARPGAGGGRRRGGPPRGVPADRRCGRLAAGRHLRPRPGRPHRRGPRAVLLPHARCGRCSPR